MRELKSNPGGKIPVETIIGRDQLIEHTWDVLTRQSVVMTSERRIGKTHVLQKMAHQPPPGWTAMLTDLERIHTADELAGHVFNQIEKHLTGWKRVANRGRKMLQDLGGAEIGGVLTLPPATWKPFLAKCIEDLVTEQENKLVFLWDEMPFMLGNIRDRQSEQVAMEVLDVLRALRQEHENFRMVLTGSVGLHHVVSALKQKGYANAPLNDMHTIEVPPLAEQHAFELASALIRGEKLTCPDLPAAASAVATAADCIPFYIHQLVRHLKMVGAAASPDTVRTAVEGQMLDANDPWELRHFRERISTYYPGREAIVIATLDILATSSTSLSAGEILAKLTSLVEFRSRDELLELLKLMDRDHYLRRDAVGFRIRFPLIARWWRLDRQLSKPKA